MTDISDKTSPDYDDNVKHNGIVRRQIEYRTCLLRLSMAKNTTGSLFANDVDKVRWNFSILSV